MAEVGLRIDKFLWFTRLAKTRSYAQATAEAGHMRIDGRPIARAHTAVRIGNVLTFALHDRVRVIRVEALPARRGPAGEARLCYTDLAPAMPSVTALRGDENAFHPADDIDVPDRPT
ncbi:RNA-binding S4 domain-containing protein [Sphingomonas solaris]|uniref:RNA-binding S4 domain-containing protein n=1 Tax=Alterirhizorhabdus solaris TaxID=2529389 RepID=A0A558QT40_9SPHN|nr:RNA-binding S4 domain-containing protein [Sphingomonas solaris]TVV70217.1 RNA-binding S4 domain-containing protein [Sphingomonas solaris]